MNVGQTAAAQESTSIGSHIVRGVAWMVGMRWLMRGIGLLNTIVLARVLSPDDFGVMAMSAVVIEFLMMLGDTNVDIALIRESETSRALYDSAWTVQMISGLVVAGLVIVAIPPLVHYYRDPRVETVMYILALRPAILGFENVGVAEFRKSLDFAKEFRYGVWRRLSLFLVGLALALTLRNYLALAIAGPISASVAVFFSFTMSSYRPRFRLSHARVVWGASRWMILQNLSQVALDRADEFIIGGVSASRDVGNYYIAAQVAPMPTRELAWPVERALMPTYAKIVAAQEELGAAVVMVMGAMGTICFSAGVGIMSVASDFVLTVFGSTWESAIPFFRWLAIFGIFAGLGRPLMPLFYAMKRERLYASICASQVLATIPVLVIAAHTGTLTNVAAGRTIVAGFFFAVFCWAAIRVSTVQFKDILLALWRPAAASIVMALAIDAFRTASLPGHILPLAHDIVVGIISFSLAQASLWLAVGRPPGAERMILGRLVRFLRA
jgi:O-antigen/teichoic acid export membrane protein